jgi:cephalosporin hydroxylase
MNFGIVQLPDELLRFHAFLRSKAPRAICEIGTASGGHIYMLASSFPTLSTLIGVDIHVWNQAFLQMLGRSDLSIHLVNGDSTSVAVNKAVRSVAPGDGLDLLFIDGDHSYAGVKADYLNYRGLVRDGGLIAFHDIIQDHAGGRDRLTGNWTGDVPELWGRLKASAPSVEFVRRPDQDGYGIGVLVHSAAMATPAGL